MNKYKTTIGLIIFIISFVPALSGAKFTITTELVWGQIISIEDKSIELENGMIYHPVNEYVQLEAVPGDTVTLETYTDRKGKLRYLKYALGENNLERSIQPKPVRRDTNF